MSLIELNAKAWDESKGINCEKTMIIVGKLKWPSQEAFDKALKELYDSVKRYRKYEY
jgi:hypothetical protein